MKKKKENDSYLSDFFDLWASFANQWATLAPRENQAKCHRWLACHVAVCHCCGNILREICKICCFSVSTVRNISVIWQVFLCVCARVVMQDWRKGAASVFHAFGHTSSNFCAIMEKALKMPSVGPVMVTILSGDEPSDMLMRAPLWKQSPAVIPAVIWFDLPDNVKLYALSHYRCQSKHSPPPSFSWLFLLSEIRQEKKSVRLDL